MKQSYKSVKQECPTRVSNKSVILPECCAIVSSKGVKNECHLSVSSQGVQVASLENVINKYCLCSSTYVSAFGFVGFILFFSTSKMNQNGSKCKIYGDRTKHVDTQFRIDMYSRHSTRFDILICGCGILWPYVWIPSLSGITWHTSGRIGQFNLQPSHGGYVKKKNYVQKVLISTTERVFFR